MVLPGFNTDFKYRGETYHAQTEDNGVNNPVVVTLLYFKGAILASKKTPYGGMIEREGWQKELMELMKSQHREIMRELLAGRFDAAPAVAKAPAPPAGAPAQAPEPAAAAAPAPATDPTPAPPAPQPEPAAPPAPTRETEPNPTAAAPPPAPGPAAAPAPAAAAHAGDSARQQPPRPAPAAHPGPPPSLDEQIRRYLRAHAAAHPAPGKQRRPSPARSPEGADIA